MDAKAVVDAFIAAHYSKDLSKISDLLDDDLKFTTLLGILGKQDYLEFARALTEAMPDLGFQIEEVSATRDDVLLKFGLEGTHTRTFNLKAPGMKPLAATHKKISLKPDLLHVSVPQGKKQIAKIFPEPGHEGGVVYLLREMGAKLPPLWIARLVNRIVKMFR